MTSQHVNPIPEGFHTATPYLIVPDIQLAIAFYEAAFGAKMMSHHADESGNIINAEYKIGDSPIMIGAHKSVDHDPERTLETLPPVSIYLYVADADALFAQAVAAQARILYPVAEMSYGNREGGVADPFGNFWWIGSRVVA